jgi:hypothetical protein
MKLLIAAAFANAQRDSIGYDEREVYLLQAAHLHLQFSIKATHRNFLDAVGQGRQEEAPCTALRESGGLQRKGVRGPSTCSL